MKPLSISPIMLAVAAFAAGAAFAYPNAGSRGEASYEEHQAQPVSQRTRAEVMAEFQQARAGLNQHGDIGDAPVAIAVNSTLRRADVQLAYQRAAVLGRLPDTSEASAESPAELVLRTDEGPAHAATSYAQPPSDAMVAALRARKPEPAPEGPTPRREVSSLDMLPNEQNLALDEGEELVAEQAPEKPDVRQ